MTYYLTSTLQPINSPRAVQYGDPLRWWDTRKSAPDRDVHLAAVGIVPLNDTAIRPADTETHTHDRTVELVGGVPTVVYIQRLWTQAELDAQQAQENRSIIDTAITNALAELDTLIAAPEVADVPEGTLTTAQLSTAMRTMRNAIQANRDGAQRVAATLKQTIRLVRGDFDGIN